MKYKECYICHKNKAYSKNYCADCKFSILSSFNISLSSYKCLFRAFYNSSSRKYKNVDTFNELTQVYIQIDDLINKYSDVIFSRKSNLKNVQQINDDFKLAQELRQLS